MSAARPPEGAQHRRPQGKGHPEIAAAHAAHPASAPDSGTAHFSIGTAAQRSGVSARMVRHYEGLGLLPPVARTEGGYRQYSDADIHTLRFIKRARDLGFAMEDIGELVGLWHNRRRSSAGVRQIAQKHLTDLETRIAALQSMQQTLAHLVQCCHGDARPECPILDDLANGP